MHRLETRGEESYGVYSNKKTKKREPVFEDGMDGRNDERGFC
jgi:hypothetical protein